MSRALVVAIFLVLLVLHQDFWLRDNASLVLEIVPIGLAYHMSFTVLAALFWLAVVRLAWPYSHEDEDDQGGEQ